MPDFTAKSNLSDAKRPAIASPELVKLIAEQRASELPHVRMYIDAMGRAVLPGSAVPRCTAEASPELARLLDAQRDGEVLA